MNTNSHFENVYSHLGIAEERLDNQDYDSSREALRKVYGHVLSLLGHVHKLQSLKDEVSKQKVE